MVHHPVAGVGILVSILTLPIGLLTALFVGIVPAAVIFIVGWFLLTPLLVVFAEEVGGLLPSYGDDESDASDDPLAELKARYARGEIDDAEFERRVERLVGAEELDAGGTAGDLDAAGPDVDDRDADPADDRERSVGRE
ncbi:SHOCT domain-containing protein [Halosimplex halophilum]|uniref:SHOCT domain-containing protein n=1 Tax=Halosimplex halophilum TaxID=2559572 RepID=UPI00107F9AA5|nr:SHOCT domain-containing protein [Halosimplex halophilum]